MQLISARELRLQPGVVWTKLQKEKTLVVTSNGKPIGLLSDLPGGDLEAALTMMRRVRGQWALQQIRRDARAQGLDRLTAAQIKREIQAARKNRRKT
jgi:hypothetical protein